MDLSYIAYRGKKFEWYVEHVECELARFGSSLNNELEHFLQLYGNGIPRQITSASKDDT